jgi:hypothetical protein
MKADATSLLAPDCSRRPSAELILPRTASRRGSAASLSLSCSGIGEVLAAGPITYSSPSSVTDLSHRQVDSGPRAGSVSDTEELAFLLGLRTARG